MDKTKRFFKEIFSWLMYMAIWLAVLFTFYHFVAQPFSVDGSSMEHTLEDGEKVWMWKLSDIERFDVVIFPQPNPLPGRQPKLYVKRVVGIPGDKIAYQNDQLLINGQAVDEVYLNEKAQEYRNVGGGNFTEDFAMEEITGEELVPEGKFFVLGDNRQNSVDGRSFGLIDADSVLGKATFIYWPIKNFGKIEDYELNPQGDAIVVE
ncbi:signal peptidase I [Facklamia sp. 7083-14-GEN3]|uniref:signal peptidase I n=1 Tax=Facklamia sp. 7083-14-GEN3 TaxID=2973478 RepID=UPI00215D1B0F|nr:signal peptidase I [Facklamia sp. 7083-14-GEN3]MCR8969567.1 signal peptidase I [Facklamia sp. 7083-14-GEN3]